MYYIRKSEGHWKIFNNVTGNSKQLNADEVAQLVKEFPNLKEAKTVTYFRNLIKSVKELP